ncbi:MULTISPECIES: hypothetical protein [unclassified Vibrio]|uniref:hypothetical protein n=1 Tax=unclassified Vibrio TaxID=2614977 RepID=UPI001361CE51|nr:MULTISPECIES: hypothetical protein [unclassified Vibrio]NAW57168.1 hypothetical protein [Vibrio sp. V36_P2S2PM302]NAX24537.1 hypothetical protein [Vibrio sp. V38_P2S17PM301]NAX31119.1 hypothetical protein [Vibrio sp. V37_P2S8PM304]
MKYQWIASLSALFIINAAHASTDITSREYKLLLDTDKFTYQSEASDVANYTVQLASVISQAINRNVSGNASLDKERFVSYWDVPNACTLRTLGYSFRDRVSRYDANDRDAALKFRSSDRFISAYEDLASNRSKAESKLEDDLLLGSDDDISIKVSHSTKISGYGKNINKIDDIYDDFPGFAAKYGVIDADTPLNRVGNITMYERRYKGQEIDLGQFDADLVVSLWYDNPAPLPGSKPVIAEASFDYADNQGEYTPKVVQRAQQAFLAMGKMSDWVKLDGITKTQFVYQYDAQFCSGQ